ncbi:DDE Tnp4 domain-containing protein [Mycena chlorophos]|uniref:DDE Tnp4 domain-containing protein n=1 Tax=Mycena chlorophos TaxID=658473 RepID=A0A8H6VYP1_MYCCL|nr:DDE Tnp4 domain-containing protein [Mycena chlorophos]
MVRASSRKARAKGIIKATTGYMRHRAAQQRRENTQLAELEARGVSARTLRKLTLLSAGVLPRRQSRPHYGLREDDDMDDISSSSSSESDSDSDSDEDIPPAPHVQPRLPHSTPFSAVGWAAKQLDLMYERRYENPRTKKTRSKDPTMKVALDDYRYNDEEAFRGELRIWPKTFNRLVKKIENHPVFLNNSNNEQKPVEQQLAVALYQFGNYGNAASLRAISNWAGLGKGTISKCTTRVITAILGVGLLKKYVRMPTEDEKEEAKRWVEKKAGCKEMRDGWCMVDGTLVPLAARPNWYGESYFDRKQNYSMNLQVINLPNLRIIDIGFGYVGSTHDATAWTGTRIYKKRQDLLAPGEWVWADAAYPVGHQFSSLSSYNTLFNNHVSYSLKGLRILIRSKTDHRYANQWIVACVAVHAYAMHHEAKLAKAAGKDSYEEAWQDAFVAEGREEFVAEQR